MITKMTPEHGGLEGPLSLVIFHDCEWNIAVSAQYLMVVTVLGIECFNPTMRPFSTICVCWHNQIVIFDKKISEFDLDTNIVVQMQTKVMHRLPMIIR